MKTNDFDYVLPPELIAQEPIEPRDASRLLVVDRATGALAHRHFHVLIEYLRPGDLLVGNDSRVIPARLHGVKPTGGEVEIFLLRPAAAAEDPAAPGPGDAWDCLVRGKGLRPGVRIEVQHTPADGRPGYGGPIGATILGDTAAGGRLVAFDPPVRDWLWDVGEVPLPPYIHSALADPERYQTVYSRIEGSVASSTAGLHFTPELLLQARDLGVNTAFVTLHIGLDTFRPVQVEEIEEHQIHREWAEMSRDTARLINDTRLAGGRIIAIGTTSVRVLESAAKIALGYQPGDRIPDDDQCGWKTVSAFTAETNLYITPGHRFRAVDAMITNFHLPKSTLLMLVSAFAGKDLIDRAYAEAIRERYRFFSFGDAMLIL
ncbi:MAG TPA: tRNA preQ1(34) S-adenosylmethionine ribosyltransferase-isomerase QueA [Anaerolineae bacterium]